MVTHASAGVCHLQTLGEASQAHTGIDARIQKPTFSDQASRQIVASGECLLTGELRACG